MQNAVFEARRYSRIKPNEKGIQYPEGIQEKYKRLYAVIRFVGWLRIPAPQWILHLSGKNNTYYLSAPCGQLLKVRNPFLITQTG